MAYNDIFRLRVYQREHGSQVVNVLHFLEDLAAVGGGAQGLANDFVTNMRATLIARSSPDLIFETVEVQSIVPFSGAAAVAAFPAATIGTRTGGTASATLAEVITIYSSRAGRRGRGRIYLAGVHSSGSGSPTGGIHSTTQTTTTTAFANAVSTRYIFAPGLGAYCLGVWSRASGPTFPPWNTSQFVRATGLTVRTIMRTQRRRQVGVGR